MGVSCHASENTCSLIRPVWLISVLSSADLHVLPIADITSSNVCLFEAVISRGLAPFKFLPLHWLLWNSKLCFSIVVILITVMKVTWKNSLGWEDLFSLLVSLGHQLQEGMMEQSSSHHDG